MEITLKNLLTVGEPVETIYYRCNSPAEDEEDMFYGSCHWDGNNLIPHDGDFYSLDEPLEKYRREVDGNLTVWIPVEWSSDNG